MNNNNTTNKTPLIEQARDLFMRRYSANNSTIFQLSKYLGRAKESRKDDAPGVICYVFSKNITNGLGMFDIEYYYLVAREYWFHNWADEDHANVPKYKHTPGSGLDRNITMDMLNSKTVGMTKLVVAVPTNTDGQNIEFWYINASKFRELIEKYQTLHKGRFDNEDWGYTQLWLTKDNDE